MLSLHRIRSNDVDGLERRRSDTRLAVLDALNYILHDIHPAFSFFPHSTTPSTIHPKTSRLFPFFIDSFLEALHHDGDRRLLLGL